MTSLNEVIRVATERRMRCGYAVIKFSGMDTARAIVAIETYHGLQYFEPQSGDEQHILIGRPYPTQFSGVPDNTVVSHIEITWNDQ